MIKLFLDDERFPKNVTWVQIPEPMGDWKIVRNYDEFCSWIYNHNIPEFVSFDHDLADQHYTEMLKDCQENSNGKLMFEISDDIKPHDYGPEKTGYDCAKFLVDFCIFSSRKFPDYQVHSMNPVGKERIIHYIENAKKHFDFL